MTLEFSDENLHKNFTQNIENEDKTKTSSSDINKFSRLKCQQTPIQNTSGIKKKKKKATN
jgi:hypothetical protein